MDPVDELNVIAGAPSFSWAGKAGLSAKSAGGCVSRGGAWSPRGAARRQSLRVGLGVGARPAGVPVGRGGITGPGRAGRSARPGSVAMPGDDQYPEGYPPFDCVEGGAGVLGALVTALPLGDSTYQRAPNWFRPWPRVSPGLWSPT